MSSGNLNTYGGKKNNFPFQHNLLLINSAISAAVAAGATEATLQLVLTALQNGQDYEAKLVRDSDTPPVNWLEVRIFNVTTGTFDPPVYYLAGSNTVGAPVLPIVYIDPTTLLATIASNTTGLATQATLATRASEATLLGIKTQTDLFNFILTALEVTVTGAMPLPAGAATEVTLAALNAKFGALGQKLMAGSAPVVIASDQSAIPISATALPLPAGAATSALQTALNGLITTLNGSVATETTLVATNALLTTIDTVLDAIKLDTAALAGASKTPSIVASSGNGSTVAGKQSVSLLFRGTGGGLGTPNVPVPSGFRITYDAKLNDTVGSIAYVEPTGGAAQVLITYLT